MIKRIFLGVVFVLMIVAVYFAYYNQWKYAPAFSIGAGICGGIILRLMLPIDNK